MYLIVKKNQSLEQRPEVFRDLHKKLIDFKQIFVSLSRRCEMTRLVEQVHRVLHDREFLLGVVRRIEIALRLRTLLKLVLADILNLL